MTPTIRPVDTPPSETHHPEAGSGAGGTTGATCSDLSTALFGQLGLVHNAAVAEWVIRGPSIRRVRRVRGYTAPVESR